MSPIHQLVCEGKVLRAGQPISDRLMCLTTLLGHILPSERFGATSKHWRGSTSPSLGSSHEL
jgi:hypothetical protein